MATLV